MRRNYNEADCGGVLEPNSFSTFAFTAASILISGGQGRWKTFAGKFLRDMPAHLAASGVSRITSSPKRWEMETTPTALWPSSVRGQEQIRPNRVAVGMFGER